MPRQANRAIRDTADIGAQGQHFWERQNGPMNQTSTSASLPANGTVLDEKSHSTRVLLTLTSVALIVTYVETMVIPGIPTIQKDFGTSADVTSWITSALLIVGSAVAPLFGKLGDTYGKKKMFLAAMAFYIAGVGMAGFAPSIYFLLLARAVQGVGFAIMPLAIAIITDVFPKERVATAQGIISGTFAIGAAAGLIIGSYIVQDLGWQWAFHTAFVLSLVLFLVAMKVIKTDVPRLAAGVDYSGAVFLMAGVTLCLLYLTEGPTLGWLSYENLAMLVPGLFLTAFFFYYETRRKNPLMQMGLLRITNILISNLVGLLSGMAMFLLFFGVIYYAELPTPFGLNLDIISAGLVLAPATFVMLVVGPLLGRMTIKVGPKPVLFMGAIVSALGMLLFIFYRATTSELPLDSAVTFIGVVAIIIPIVNMISVSLPRENVAVGLGMNTMLRNVGGAIGPVVATTIMTTYTSPLTFTSPLTGVSIVIAQLPSSYAFNLIFSIGIALVAAVAAMSLFVRNYTFGGGRRANQERAS
jgi:MFS family permease